MTYKSEFTSLQGNTYTLTIDTPTPGGTLPLPLSSTPFVSSIDASEDGIYSPVRCGGATLSLLTDRIITDFYSVDPLHAQVKLTQGSKVLWTGFVSPTMYDQGYDGELEELDLDCVDGLAVLKFLPYLPDKKEMRSFYSIIRNCLIRSKSFSTLYISDNVQLYEDTTQDVTRRLLISEGNFFDDKDDPAQSDESVAWNCHEVLSEIMRYLGMTILCEGQEVYIVDYDAIKRGEHHFFRYDLATDTDGHNGIDGERVTVNWGHRITGADYAASGTRVSLDKIYNRVTVVDDFRSVESLVPTFGDKAFETNITSPTAASATTVFSNYRHFFTITQTLPDGTPDTFQIFMTTAWPSLSGVGSLHNGYKLVIVRFYRSEILEFKRYRGSGPNKEDYTEAFEKNAGWAEMLRSYGASYVKIWQKDLTMADELRFNTMWRAHGQPTGSAALPVWKEFLQGIDPGSIKLEPLIIFTNPNDGGHIGPTAIARTGNYNVVSGQGTDIEDCQKYPCVVTRGSLAPSIFGGSGSYLVLKGTFSQHNQKETPIPLPTDFNAQLDFHGDYKDASELYFWTRIRWGDWYLAPDGSWTSVPSTYFPVWWRKDKGDISVQDYFAAEFKLADSSGAAFITSDDGVYIAPPDTGVSGQPEVTIFMPRDSRGHSKNNQWKPDGGNYYWRYLNEVQFLKGFALDLKPTTGGIFDEDTLLSDTVYSNVIENGSTEEMGEITFRVCTYDGKSQSYSVVGIYTPPSALLADKLYNRALFSLQGAPLRQEEQMVWKCVNQYSRPRLIFQCTLKNALGVRLYGSFTHPSFPDSFFVVGSRETDWQMESVTLKLLEKA